MKGAAFMSVNKSDESVTSHSLPGFAVKSETSERKRPIERSQKERNSSFLVSFVIDCSNG